MDYGELFASTAPFYAKYRAGYPVELFAGLAGRLGLDGSQVAADIGCGTGNATIPLAGLVRKVIAVDPQPQMLEQARAAAEAAGATNIEWRVGDSTGLRELGIDGADLAVFAASWHWTDRPAVARDLDELLDPGGALVIIDDGLADQDDPDWVRAITEIRARYLGPVRLAGSGVYVRPEGGNNDEVLLASPFSAVERLSRQWQRSLSVEEAVGLQFSYSFSTPAMFGDRAGEFADDVRAAVLALHPDGVVVERLHTCFWIGRRP